MRHLRATWKKLATRSERFCSIIQPFHVHRITAFSRFKLHSQLRYQRKERWHWLSVKKQKGVAHLYPTGISYLVPDNQADQI